MSALLELEGVSARYDEVQALHGVSFEVPEGEMVAVLGANGAGKTTTLRAISNTVRKTGDVVFAGRRISRRAPESIARLGIAHVPEGRGIVRELSVRENLRLGAYTRPRSEAGREEARAFERFPRLRERQRQAAGTLSGGEQQMLALARALMQRPRLLMLDEPSLGLAPMIVREIFAILARLNADEGLTVLVVEQNAALALRTCQRACVLEVGRLVMQGESAMLREHDAIRRAYLGY
jgi:branched-chain amino acid transport system ATP-binding protein